MANILLLNGPNLNLLGSREPGLYGSANLEDIVATLTSSAAQAGHTLSALQSNAEHQLIERVHCAATDGTDLVIINPAAFTHTSIALRDALLAVAIPFIEVHLSNIYNREAFRKDSYFSDIAIGVISGFGALSYQLALAAAIEKLPAIEQQTTEQQTKRD